LRLLPPGPNNHAGISAENSTKPEEIRNQVLTNPPCSPIQPHKKPLSIFRSRAKTEPNKNKPANKPKDGQISDSKEI